MDVFRFAKLPMRANAPTRRYRIVRGDEREHVGEVKVHGDAPDVSDAAREYAPARRFLTEMVTGWGLQAREVGGGTGWAEQPDGRFRVRLEYDTV